MKSSFIFNKDEKPLENPVNGYSNTAIFRKIAIIGDSLSSGEFETCDENGNKNFYDMFEYSWGQYIARKNGLTAYNFSRGGMTAKEYMESFAEANGFWDKDKACQAYVIALGWNDIYGLDMEIGGIQDIDEADSSKNRQTFIGYYAAIVDRYKKICPDAKFFFVTLPKSEDKNQEKVLESVEKLHELSKYFDNSYVIDLYNYAPVENEEFKKNFYLHGHMNPMGYILTARMIDSYIDYIIRKSPNDFKNVPFIGTGIKY